MNVFEVDASLLAVESFVTPADFAAEVRELLAPYTVWFLKVMVLVGPFGAVEVAVDVRADRPSAAIALVESILSRVADVTGCRVRERPAASAEDVS